MSESPETRYVIAEPDRAGSSPSTVPNPVGEFGQTLQTRSGLDPIRDSGPEIGKEANSAGQSSASHDSTPPQGNAGRHQLFGEIGHGAMGSVLRARDPDLKRDLAVKVLRETHKNNADAIRRFTEEAQITGQLQHPGIVPVHEIGQFADGRPYFTMKLVKGKTLSALLAARPAPAEDLPRFLSIFLRICQPMAYAHSRRVIHRDLKPANVMVGAFGEVQVMDWGLAKVLTPGHKVARAAPANQGSASIIRTVRTDSDADESRDGSVIGTPAYMPPEQANGELDRVDERADVFGLGAILCEILTGRPPYAGRSGSEVLRLASRADLAPALTALKDCGANEELANLTRDCLAAEPDDRPRDAGVVAERLVAHLASVQERFATAQRDRAAAEARADEARSKAQVEKKARQLTAWLAVASIAAVLIAGITYYRSFRERAQIQFEVGYAIADATSAVRGGHWSEAHAKLERAAGQLAFESFPDLHRKLEILHAELEMAVRLEAINLEKFSPDAEGRFDLAKADRAYEKSFRDYGLDVLTLPVEEAAERVRGAVIHDPLVAGVDDWSLSIRNDDEKRHRLMALGRLIDANEFGREVRETILNLKKNGQAKMDTEPLEKLIDRPEIAALPPTTLRLLGKALIDAKGYSFAAKFYRAARQRRPGYLWFNLALAITLSRGSPAQVEEAGPYFACAVVLRPETSITHLFQANYLNDCERWTEAEVSYRAAIELQKDLAQAHYGLGRCLAGQRRNAEAVASFREALQLKPDDPMFLCSLGNALATQGKYVEAADAWRRGHEFGSKTKDWSRFSARSLRDFERMIALAKDFPAFLRDDARPADAEDLVLLGRMSLVPKRLPRTAARFFAAALAAKPTLADALATFPGFDAARASVLAAARLGNDAAALAPEEQTRLRKQALTWLRADLALWSKNAESDKDADRIAAVRALKRWHADADLASVRSEKTLANLPPEERHAWREFWAQVYAVLDQAKASRPPD